MAIIGASGDSMDWYAGRTVYLFEVRESGMNIFEERIVCFKAEGFSDAHLKAEVESENYALSNGFEAHPEQLIYRQDGEDLIEGYELWSELYQSNKDLKSFYEDRYKIYLYNSE